MMYEYTYAVSAVTLRTVTAKNEDEAWAKVCNLEIDFGELDSPEMDLIEVQKVV
jgi:hypothetical protein